MDFEDLGAVVTGASRGLGRAIALSLGRRGARVVLVARGEAELEETAAAVRAASGRAWSVAADVGAPGAGLAVAAQAIELAGSIDLLVHAASTLGPLPMPLLADTSPEAMARVFEVNVLGPFRLTRALVGPMLLRGAGTVVSVSSDAAVEAYPGWGAYGASKAALDHLTRIWAAEARDAGVRFLAIDPGEMDTAMHAAAMPDADRSTLADPADVAERIVGALAAGAIGPRLVVGEAA